MRLILRPGGGKASTSPAVTSPPRIRLVGMASYDDLAAGMRKKDVRHPMSDCGAQSADHLPRAKPLFRGVSHQVAAMVAAPLAALLVAGATGATARGAALVYGASLVALFVASAVYHRPRWSPPAREVMGRIDHAAIYLLIAGTYTPICLLLGPRASSIQLAVVWGAAAVGMVVAFAWDDAPKPLRAAIYVAVGWALLPTVWSLRGTLGASAFTLLGVGSALYTLGACVFALRRPDPFPATFGFHEIFHALVVGAAGCHFVAVASVIRALDGHP
jgi:hemolysin III